MDIYLNGERLDFRLETEKTVSDVLAALEKWLAGSGLWVDALVIDGVSAELSGPTDAPWRAASAGAVKRLDISLAGPLAARLGALRAAREYLRHLDGALEGLDVRLLDELAGGYPAMVESVRATLEPVPGGDLHGHLVAMDQMLAGNTASRIAAWSPETAAVARRRLASIEAAVADELEQWDDPLRALGRLLAALDGELGRIGDVSVLLQTGKDRDAMVRVAAFSELTRNLISVVSRLEPDTEKRSPDVSGVPIREFEADLNGYLRQLLEAFTTNDSVLIGDLLEYEVAPRVRQLQSAASRLHDREVDRWGR